MGCVERGEPPSGTSPIVRSHCCETNSRANQAVGFGQGEGGTNTLCAIQPTREEIKQNCHLTKTRKRKELIAQNQAIIPPRKREKKQQWWLAPSLVPKHKQDTAKAPRTGHCQPNQAVVGERNKRYRSRKRANGGSKQLEADPVLCTSSCHCLFWVFQVGTNKETDLLAKHTKATEPARAGTCNTAIVDSSPPRCELVLRAFVHGKQKNNRGVID